MRKPLKGSEKMANASIGKPKIVVSETEMLPRKRMASPAWSKEFPSLTINNFSCIRDLTVEFPRLVVFIGEQASGKSITCKLYYFFTQALLKVATTCLREGVDVDDFRKRLIREFGLIFPSESWHHDSFTIEWRYGANHMSVTHKRSNKNIKVNLFDYKDHYERAAKRIVEYDANGSKAADFDFRWKFDEFVTEVVSKELASVSVDYIPAGRSFFSTIQDVVFSLLSNNVGIDYFLKEFGQKLEAFRRVRHMWPGEADRQILFEDLCHQILHGKYYYDGKEQWIIANKDHKIRLADASSGQQEALPLLMVLSRREAFFRRRGLLRIVIEEPEAHLYPTAQQEIVNAIGNILLTRGAIGSIITTHSPFILCCLNNVLKWHQDLQKSVSAYHLHDGVGDRIYASDLGLINAERFDDISFSIANA